MRITTMFLLVFLLVACQGGQSTSTPAPQEQPPAAVVEASGSVTSGPSNIRQFTPNETDNDTYIADYFEDAGPIAAEWYEHVQLLANPWLGGRAPGTDGSRRAGEFIAWNFQQDGLSPAFDGRWYQPFDFEIGSRAPRVTEAACAIGDIALKDGEEFVVLGNSASGRVSAPVTFVGYGIEEGQDGYSSFDADTDLTGRIALLLRYEPLDEEGASRWVGRRFSPHSAMRGKVAAVVERGAEGIILVNPPDARDGRRGLETPRSSSFGVAPVPVVQWTADIANRLLVEVGVSAPLRALRQRADDGDVTTIDFTSEVAVTINATIETPSLQAQNVGGVLAGRGSLADEWMVIGGHYDHLGHGYTGSRDGSNDLHAGADDNASGTAGVIVLARMLSDHYADSDAEDLRSVLFLLFDGEEAGLHGSQHFVDHPSVPLESINVMLNMDMIGRLRGNQVLMLGTGTAAEFDELIPRLVAESGVRASLTPGGTGPSDHANFYANGIPVLFFFTGITDEYHTPRDRAHTLNPRGAAQIITLAGEFARELVAEPTRITFQENTRGRRSAGRPASPVRLGIQPSYTAELDTGIALAGVSEGTSAADAGLRAGDVLLAWNEEELTGGRRLMELLRESKPGEAVTFVVQRDGTNIEVPVTLRAPSDDG